MEKKMTFNKWFDTFLEEKNLPYAEWELRNNDGVLNFINSDVVIESIKNAPSNEKKQIKKMIVYLDFKNLDINDYFKHLAGALINN